jgi:hypothetical protein
MKQLKLRESRWKANGDADEEFKVLKDEGRVHCSSTY